MLLTHQEPPISEQQIVDIQTNLGVHFPIAICKFYLSSNGGIPDLYVFENKQLDTVISEFFPLASNKRRTAIQTYNLLVRDKRLVAPQFFPFAVDGGGDYFFVDCLTEEGLVYFYRSDTASGKQLLSLELGFEAFCESLKKET